MWLWWPRFADFVEHNQDFSAPPNHAEPMLINPRWVYVLKNGSCLPFLVATVYLRRMSTNISDHWYANVWLYHIHRSHSPPMNERARSLAQSTQCECDERANSMIGIGVSRFEYQSCPFSCEISGIPFAIDTFSSYGMQDVCLFYYQLLRFDFMALRLHKCYF